MKRPSFEKNANVEIIAADYTEFSRINGVETNACMYGWIGTVTDIIGFNDKWEPVSEPYTAETYPTNWQVDVKYVSPVTGDEYTTSFRDWENQLKEIEIRKFICIVRLVDGTTEEFELDAVTEEAAEKEADERIEEYSIGIIDYSLIEK